MEKRCPRQQTLLLLLALTIQNQKANPFSGHSLYRVIKLIN